MLPPIARSPSHFSEVRRSLSLSLYDGFFASVYAVLTGGFFLTGFALSLGATEWEIGLLAALPFVANWFQFVGSYLVQRMGRRAPVCVWTATTARLLWLLVALLPFSRRSHEDWIIWGLMVLVATSYFLGAISAVAWLSWIADVVPENLRGRFFGRRNMFNGIATVGTSLIGGWFLDAWGKTLSDFQWLFLVAVMAGLMSIGFLKRIPEPPLTSSPQKQAYFRALLRPLIDANFRRLLLFTMVWSFGVNLASPFFVVYKLNDLQLSYTWIALLASLTSFFDLLGMRYWGPISDRMGNRPVMLICSLVAAFLPFGWLWTTKSAFSIYVVLPLLHIAGGFFWAGMNLSSANILFRLAPREQDTVYFATHASLNGLLAASATLCGGLIGQHGAGHTLRGFTIELGGLKIVFLISWLLRLSALPFLWRVREPKERPLVPVMRILRSIRAMTTTNGFHPLLHFFISIAERPKNVWRGHFKNHEETRLDDRSQKSPHDDRVR